MKPSPIYNQLREGMEEGRKFFAWLIDPDKFQKEALIRSLGVAESAGVNFIFVGGSLLMDNRIHECLHTIRTNTALPVILFPGNSLQFSDEADALLFLSLISGRNPDLLIGRHVEIAPILKKSNLESIATGYMLIDAGLPTTASYISQTQPIPYHKNDIAVSTAIAGELLGLKAIYMDCGSGASQPIHSRMISAVRENINIPLIIGGGIRTMDEVQSTYRAGADVVVVGNAIESNHELLPRLAGVAHQFMS